MFNAGINQWGHEVYQFGRVTVYRLTTKRQDEADYLVSRWPDEAFAERYFTFVVGMDKRKRGK